MFPPTKDREAHVQEFHEAAGNKTLKDGGDIGVHIVCFGEELAEFNEALAAYVINPDDPDLRKNMIKEWCDVQYTLSVFPWYLGFDGQTAFNRVAQNNNSKLVNGKVFRRSDGKIMKPEGYQPVDMSNL